jgi:hypothetical protein
MRAFLGFVASFHSKHPQLYDVHLSSYSSSVFIADFLAYLMARNVGKGHLLQHLSLARKVNNFLSASNSSNPRAVDYLDRLEAWLAKVEAQVSKALARRSAPRETPSADILYSWARARAAKAVDLTSSWSNGDFRDDFNEDSFYEDARYIHDSILIAFITGAYIPPCRISLIRTWSHPSEPGCTDPDCLVGSCKGNRLVPFNSETNETFDDQCASSSCDSQTDVFEAYLSWLKNPPTFDSIQSIVVHGKNDRRPRACDIKYVLPPGDLTTILLAHITLGHLVISSRTKQRFRGTSRMFVSSFGGPFDNSGFTQYWGKIVKTCNIARQMNISYFQPSAVRTTWVEDACAALGMPPNHWDGAAVVMGSNTRQWTANVYYPNKPCVAAQNAIDVYNSYIERRTGGSSNDRNKTSKRKLE